ncbi:two-component regulator propeller domain-containing protein [Pontibacter sp. G13]|uniref:hybrid sensor histidine kinase/response regulator transcription factor n=1 Tax=Pontibacter sp. G13 TaxID=3074898 RepID=UPI002889AF41|nr:two-component regulator propeller domain-containing protein [Pontibacter sp. G13]WNJ16997.1 two-component regulator propeller domain-containing protein [Pontibacter sp. G13]
MLACSSMMGQVETFFEHLSSNDGLSQNDVLCLHQDQFGYIWIGTNDGLNQYNGYTFKTFKPDPDDPYSIRGNLISCIEEDEEGNLWIGTIGYGLNFFDRKEDRFYPLSIPEGRFPQFSDQVIRAIFLDKHKRLWVASRKGVYVSVLSGDRQREDFVKIWEPGKTLGKTEVLVNFFFQDRAGTIWMGTNRGFTQVEPSGEHWTFTSVPMLGRAQIHTMLELPASQFLIGTSKGIYLMDRNGRWDGKVKLVHPQPVLNLVQHGETIWGGANDGLCQFEWNGHELTLAKRYQNDIAHEASLSTDRLKSLLVDRTGILWVGTFGGGINQLDLGRKNFRHYSRTLRPGTLAHHIVRLIHEDSNGSLWVGTYGGGLSMLLAEDHDGSFEHFIHFKEVANPVSMTEIHQDGRKILEIGTSDGKGPYRIDITRPSRQPVVSKTQTGEGGIFSIHQDQYGQIWYGTYSNGLLRRTEVDDLQVDRLGLQHGIHSLTIRNIYQDKHGNLWIGTSNGLHRLKAEKLLDEFPQFEHFGHDPEDSTSLSFDYIMPILETSEGEMWIGTLGGGLNRMIQDPSDGSIRFKAYTEKEGLANNAVKGIEEDDEGNLWISTNHGISRFDPHAETFQNFDHKDGLQGNEFQELTSLRLDNGDLMFGGVNGFNVFTPEEIQQNPIPPEVRISRMFLGNEPVQPGQKVDGRQILDQVVMLSDHIELQHNQNHLAFEFEALHFAAPQKNKYRYRLKDFETQWRDIPASQRRVSYTNLPPGDYTFEVMAANSDDVWNPTPAQLHVTIHPPFWLTNWAYGAYFLLIVSLLWAFRRYTLIGVKEKHELMMEHLQAEKLEELNRMKERFFTNVSHEFRTPLSLIGGPLKYLKHHNAILMAPERMKQLNLIQRNTDLLEKLINQLLDFQRIEQGQENLEICHQNLIPHVESIHASFEFVAQQRDLHFMLDCEFEELTTYFSPDAIEKILNNLISNAFKYTPDGGEVLVKISRIYQPHEGESEGFVQIEVIDDGRGIARHNLSRIFERFFQEDESDRYRGESMGIGLALTRTLVQLHHGSIQVESAPQEGTHFTIKLPMSAHYYADDQVLPCYISPKEEGNFTTPATISNDGLEAHKPGKKPKILLVEDNSDLRTFICAGLSRKYQIIEAVNGQDGLDKLKEHHPNVIVSDVMMPVMDGITFASSVKRQFEYNHIPILFLTARSDDETHLQGLQSGAHDFIVKPFDLGHLELKLDNIIRYRREFQTYIQRKLMIQPEEIEVTSTDREFIDRVVDLLEEHIMDSEFNVEMVVRELGISRTAAYTKCKEMTGISLGEFIRRFRLKRAHHLLSTTDLTVKEIMYMSGFNTAGYFSRCFKNMYGYLPSEVRSQAISPSTE